MDVSVKLKSGEVQTWHGVLAIVNVEKDKVLLHSDGVETPYPLDSVKRITLAM